MGKIINALLSPLAVAIVIYLFYQLPISFFFSGLLDEGFLLYNAWLISEGQIPYKDFFMTSTPASYYVVAFFFEIIENHILITRILGIAIAIITLVVSASLFKLSKLWQYIYLIALALLLVAPARFFFYNEAFTILFITLLVFLLAIKNNNLYLIGISGILSGLCFLFKQSVGGLLIPAVILCILLAYNKKNWLKTIATYLMGNALILLPTALYFYINGALSEAFYFIFSFANDVKSHQASFLINRLIAIPILITLFIFIKKSSFKIRLAIGIVTLIVLSVYIIFVPEKLGRFIDYLPDPVFYAQSLAFIFPLIILAFYLSGRNFHEKKITTVAIFYLVAFLALAASGYSAGPAVVVAPLLIPLLIIFSKDKLKKKKNKYFSKIILFGFIALYTAAYSYNPFGLKNTIFAGYPNNEWKSSLNIESAKHIRFPEKTSKDISDVISYINTHTKNDEKIFCFPYCPGLLYLAERRGPFYNLFWFETFMKEDQDSLVEELKKEVRIIVLEKNKVHFANKTTTDIEFERLPKLREYILENYEKVHEQDGFIVVSKISK